MVTAFVCQNVMNGHTLGSQHFYHALVVNVHTTRSLYILTRLMNEFLFSIGVLSFLTIVKFDQALLCLL